MEKRDITLYKIAIIAGVILGMIFFPWWIFVITIAILPGMFSVFGQVIFLTIPVAISIGLIIYGIIMILKQKKIITKETIRIFRLIHYILLFMGIILFLGGFIMLSFGNIISVPLIILAIFFICLGISIPKSSKGPTPSKKKIIENSKKVVDYLKIDNSGITQLRLSSVLQMDTEAIKKCLNYLEWLGVIEKKKVSAEETLFFYKKVDEKYTNDEAI